MLRRSAACALLASTLLAQTADAQRTPLNPAERALHAAAESGDVAGIRAALARGADINATDERGRTAAMVATHARRTQSVKVLLESGADVNLRDQRLDNPFLYAGAEGLLDILKLAIAAKADTRITNRYGGTALIPAAERGHVDVVHELLVRTNTDVNHINNLGWTALLEAVVLSDGGPRHQRIVGLLVEHGADVNIADRNAVTPLAHARNRGYTVIEGILVKAGAR